MIRLRIWKIPEHGNIAYQCLIRLNSESCQPRLGSTVRGNPTLKTRFTPPSMCRTYSPLAKAHSRQGANLQSFCIKPPKSAILGMCRKFPVLQVSTLFNALANAASFSKSKTGFSSFAKDTCPSQTSLELDNGLKQPATCK